MESQIISAGQGCQQPNQRVVDQVATATEASVITLTGSPLECSLADECGSVSDTCRNEQLFQCLDGYNDLCRLLIMELPQGSRGFWVLQLHSLEQRVPLKTVVEVERVS